MIPPFSVPEGADSGTSLPPWTKPTQTTPPPFSIPEGADSGLSLPPIPSKPGDVEMMPPPYEQDVFTHNGQKYQCKWVYCCSPVGPQIPEKLEPNPNEDYLDIVVWQDDDFPEYKVEKCGNEVGFCLGTRNSTFRIVLRIIFPKNVGEEVRKEIQQCLEEGAKAALFSIGAQIAAMEGFPESIPAILPTMMETAYLAGEKAFLNCIKAKASYKYLSGKVRISVFHDQVGRGDWRTFNSRDALKLLEKWYLVNSGLAMIPGVGSFDDLANKIGVDKEGLNNFFKSPGKSVEHWKDEINKGWGKAKKEADDFFNRLKPKGKLF
jgi:hypothetical protein